MQQSDSIRRASGLRLVYSFITASALLGSLYISRADCVNPPSSLVSWWRAEGNGADVIGAHDGSFPYGSLYVTGKVGQAWDFDGGSRRLSVPDSPDFKLTNAMTLEAWVYPRAYDGFLFFRGDNRGGLDSFVMDLYTPGVVKFQIDDASNNYAYVTAPLQLNQWQHVAGTWDRASGNMRIYVNGVLGGQTNTALIPLADLDPAQEPGVGLGNHAGTFHEFGLNGLLDEPAIYSRALSASEILAIYEAGTGGKCVPPPLLVVPNYLKTNETTSASGTLNHAIRIQEVYLNTEFPNQPIRIKELRFRPSAQWGNAFSVVVSNLQVKLSTTSKAPYGLSSTFAENIGSDETTVFSGSLPISSQFTGPANGPKDFDIIIPLQTPFVYNPAQGNLLLDLRNPDNSGGSHLSAGSGLAGGSRAFSGNADSPSATTVDSGVDALGIVFEPVVSSPSVLSGPVTNSANGHVYYLLSGSTWTDAEAKAIQLGGHLVTINDEAENAWVFSTFGSYGGTNRELWIGLNDAAQEGTFVWASGEPVSYTKWYPGDPNNYNNEDYGAIWAPVHDSQGRWADWANIAADGQGNPLCGVVEIGTNPLPGVPIIAGPFTNTANGHVYYLLSGSTWTEAEAKAIELGGHLVTINDESENNWVCDTFSVFGGIQRELWIGLSDAAQEGTFQWANGEPVTYTRWYSGEPNDLGGQDYVHIWPLEQTSTRTWDDIANIAVDDNGRPFCGVVEIAPPVPTIPLLVVPNVLKTNDEVFGGGTLRHAMRSQQVYRNTEFPAQSIRIKELRFRPDRTYGFAFSTVISNLQVNLSTTAKQPNGLSATYAENSGPDDTMVFNGPLAISSQFTGPASGPKDFDIVIPLQVPFVYNPAQGNLLMDIRNFSGSGATPLSGGSGLPEGWRAWGLDVNSPTAPYVEGGIDALGIAFELVEPPVTLIPQITGFSPGVGTNGTLVTLTGTNFSSVASNNIVFFGAVRASVTAASPTSLTVVVPVGATFAPPTVTIAGLTAEAPMPFLPTYPGGGGLTASSFNSRVDLPAGDGSQVVRIADLNSDGRPDLAVNNVYGKSASLFRNLSAGGNITAASFQLSATLPAPFNTYYTRVADLDGDGKLDVLVANLQSNSISIFRNVSAAGALDAGAFAPRVDFPTGPIAEGLAVQDLDLDGRPDIVVVNQGNSTVSVLRNLSTPGMISGSSFAPKVDFPVGSTPHDVGLVDLDGDRRPEIVTADFGGASLSILRNLTTLGGGIASNSFAPRVALSMPSQPRILNFGDMDGDGRLDLVVACWSGGVISVCRNLGTGTISNSAFAAPVNFAVSGNCNAVALGDLDGDGKPDIAAVTDISSHLSVFRNVSAPGSFTAASLAPRFDLPSGSNPQGLCIGDLNADGCPEIVFANANSDTVSIYENLGMSPPNLTLQPASKSVIAGSMVTFTAAADGSQPLAYQWNWNGTNIIGATNATYSIASVQEDQAGLYSVRVTNLFGTADSSNALLVVIPAPPVPVISDFSPKAAVPGSLVSIVGTNFSSVAASNIVYFGAERAMVTSASPNTLQIVVPASATYAPPAVTVGGLTGAAKESFTPTFAGGGLLTASNFAPRANLTPGVGPIATVMADFDGDGKPDLAVTDGTGHTISVFQNLSASGTLGTNSFAPRVFLAGAGAGSDTPYLMVAADVDGDGRLDLVTTDKAANSVSVFRNIGAPGALSSNSFAARVSFAVGTSPRGLAVCDLDGDGRPEIVTANYGTANVSILRNQGVPGTINSNSFAARIDLAMGSGANGLAVADLDGDGKPDIATANNATTTISIRRNLSTLGTLNAGSFAAPFTLAGPSTPHHLRAADLDGDGKLDLLLTTYLGPQSLSVYRNLATPGTLASNSFAPRVEFALGARGHSISIGDLNGDAKPDVVVDCEIPDRVCVFQNLSTPGGFTNQSFAARVDLPAGYNAWGSSVGDLDGDARPDVAFANFYSGTLSIVQNLMAPPKLLQQPGNQTVYVGDLAALSVAATGSAPLSYQWWFGGNALQAGTNASLVLPSVQVADAGTYWVTVSNLAGSATSSNAVLNVLVPECTPAPAGLVSWWPGEGTPADVVATNNAEIMGGENYAAGKVGVGLEFKSYTNFARIPAAPALDVGAAAGFTIEGWILPRDIVGFHPIWEWHSGQGEPGTHLWVGRFPSSSGELFANIVATDGGHHTIWSGNGVLVSNVFQHVALTYDKVSGVARLLRNGQVVAEANLGSFTPKTDSDVFIGHRVVDAPGSWTYNTWFNGVLDELSLYNRALGTNEIAAIYAARGEGKCALPPTVLAVTPPSALVNEGETVSFTVSATGVGPLSYQWQHGGVDLAGANAATLVLSNIAYAQVGNYRVAVSNAGGVTLSSNVVLTVNRLPLADAGATDKLLISPNGSNVVAVLDGSLSSDPDGNALTYAWFHIGDASPFASGVIAVTVLPVGTNDLTLVVSDGMASASQAFAVEVITTADAVDRLITLVQTNVDKANALVASLRAALAAIDRSQPETAINQLEAFINKVQAQLEPTDPALAAQLIADAQAIIDALNGGGAPAPAATVEITSISQGSNGKPHLKIKGLPGRVHIVETSTDMVNWVKVGVAAGAGGSDYRFDDTQAPAGGRFYRVVSPK